MRALVIGATGFIGLNLVDALLASGHEVRATRRRSSPTMFLRRRSVELHEASLAQPEQLRRAMHGCDTVFLAGAYYPRYSTDLSASLEEGVGGVRNACEAAQAVGVERFVYTSSTATLAQTPYRPATEDDVPPTIPTGSVYAATKWAMERELEEHAARGLRAVTLLPGGCVGPWDLRLGTGGILVALMRGELPFWVDGLVSLVDVADVAAAHVAAREAQATRYCLAPHTLNFGSLIHHIVARYGGRVPSRIGLDLGRQLADEAERAAAPSKARVAFPRELVDMVASGQPIDCSRAAHDMALHFTPLRTALDRAHAWFCRYHYVNSPPAQGATHHDQH